MAVEQGLSYVSNNYGGGPGAVVLPRAKYDPLDMLVQSVNNIDRWAEEQQKMQVVKKVRLQKMLADLDVKPDGMYPGDLSWFVEKKKKLTDFYANALAQNVNPDNPYFLEDYRKAQGFKDEIVAGRTKSINFNTQLNYVGQHADGPNADFNSTMDYAHALAAMPLDKRPDVPIVQKKQFDLGAAINKLYAPNQELNAKGNTTDTPKVDDNGRRTISYTEHKVDYGDKKSFKIKMPDGTTQDAGGIHDKVIQAAGAFLDNPDASDHYNKYLSRLKDGLDTDTGQPLAEPLAKANRDKFEQLGRITQLYAANGQPVTSQQYLAAIDIEKHNGNITNRTTISGLHVAQDPDYLISKRESASVHLKEFQNYQKATAVLQKFANVFNGNTDDLQPYPGDRGGFQFKDLTGANVHWGFKNAKGKPAIILDNKVIPDPAGGYMIGVVTDQSVANLPPDLKKQSDDLNDKMAALHKQGDYKSDSNGKFSWGKGTDAIQNQYQDLQNQQQRLEMQGGEGWTWYKSNQIAEISSHYVAGQEATPLNVTAQFPTAGKKLGIVDKSGNYQPIKNPKQMKGTSTGTIEQLKSEIQETQTKLDTASTEEEKKAFQGVIDAKQQRVDDLAKGTKVADPGYKIGQKMVGKSGTFKYLGGDHTKKENWEKVE